jgi:hypothetical protein
LVVMLYCELVEEENLLRFRRVCRRRRVRLWRDIVLTGEVRRRIKFQVAECSAPEAHGVEGLEAPRTLGNGGAVRKRCESELSGSAPIGYR